jgi:Arc/MetJ-type ribon-helix-helix transcriptional regulator
MAATVAQPQKELLRRLLKAGRWTNESEIVRYGIELVRREVERERLSPLPDKVLARCYKQMSADELAEDRRMGNASAKPNAQDLE